MRPDHREVKDSKKCKLKLALGIMAWFGAGALVTIAGFVLTLLYLFTTRHLHAAGQPNLTIYLIAPVTGALVTLAGSGFTLRKWMKSKQ